MTAFVTPFGLYEFTTMPFGWQNPAGYLQKVLNIILNGVQGCEIYIDDILIHAATFDQYLERLNEVLRRLDQYNFTLSKEKCAFNLTAVEYLGHAVSSEGTSIVPAKKKAVLGMLVPDKKTDRRSFLGLVGYFRDFIPNYTKLSKPLTDALKGSYPKGKIRNWSEDHEEAFYKLKEAAANCATLCFPEDKHKLVLRTDASTIGIGGHLL